MTEETEQKENYKWLENEPHSFLFTAIKKYPPIVPLILTEWIQPNLPFELCFTCISELKQGTLLTQLPYERPSLRMCNKCFDCMKTWMYNCLSKNSAANYFYHKIL